jgi:hypothetical protein
LTSVFLKTLLSIKDNDLTLDASSNSTAQLSKSNKSGFAPSICFAKILTEGFFFQEENNKARKTNIDIRQTEKTQFKASDSLMGDTES